MRVALSATGPNLDNEIDPRFGRCSYFIIIDPDTMEYESIDNTGSETTSGVGIATAQVIMERYKDLGIVITGHCGPNAYQVLESGNIQVITGISGEMRKVVQDYKSGKYQTVSQSDVSSHSGSGRRRGQNL
jgi:predicted Fe-Mo cluster-binding NifX family protein